MTDTKDTPHPSNITEEQREELRKSDPAAFTDGDDADADTAAAEQTEADRMAAEKAEAERIAAEKAEAEKQAAMIPKGRLNEVLRERDAERERADALAAEIAALKAGPKIDYAAEIVALAKRYEEDDDFTHDDYLAQRDKLLVGQIKAEARAEIEQENAERAAKRAMDDWAAAANAFVEAHPEYAEGDAKIDLEAALHGVFAKFPQASDADKLDRAHRIVQAMNGNTEPAAAAEAPKGPNAGRDAADARAATTASAAPPIISGGVGGRGTGTPAIDFERMKPGDWSKLSRAERVAALGGEEAL